LRSLKDSLTPEESPVNRNPCVIGMNADGTSVKPDQPGGFS
jgi:hypothetical protein